MRLEGLVSVSLPLCVHYIIPCIFLVSVFFFFFFSLFFSLAGAVAVLLRVAALFAPRVCLSQWIIVACGPTKCHDGRS
ncbi:hypothetical protein TRSC58_07688 [Trypanosoma rangeli SC58]|uniref:Transmembrane protein n=1 Tax=Trypanosoma rangeli SC58 TaxID=429131 RepID=A0A061ISP5_TRYRA|nr:hypothetical protein TRSC58_07688 [Trypanosoma rangeli SC58]